MGKARLSGGIVATLIATLVLVPAADAKLRPGDLLVTDYDGRVVLVKPKSGTARTFTDHPSFDGPAGLAFRPDKRIVLADENSERLYTISPRGRVRTLLDEGVEDPYGLAFSTLHGILVADPADTGFLYRVPRRRALLFSSGGFFETPIGVAVGPGGRTYVIERDGFSGDGGVIRVSDQGLQTEVTSGGFLESPFDGIVNSKGQIFVSNSTGQVVRVNPGGGNQRLLADDIEVRGDGIAIGFDGFPIVTVDAGVARVKNGQLVPIAPVNGVMTDVAVVPPSCGGKWATSYGTKGRDRINGSPGDDVIVGLGGHDDIEGRGGNDLICGKSGDDDLDGGPGRDRAFGAAGDDECRAEREFGC